MNGINTISQPQVVSQETIRHVTRMLHEGRSAAAKMEYLMQFVDRKRAQTTLDLIELVHDETNRLTIEDIFVSEETSPPDLLDGFPF